MAAGMRASACDGPSARARFWRAPDARISEQERGVEMKKGATCAGPQWWRGGAGRLGLESYGDADRL